MTKRIKYHTDDQGQQPEDQAEQPPPRKLRLDILELEAAFESLSEGHQVHRNGWG